MDLVRRVQTNGWFSDASLSGFDKTVYFEGELCAYAKTVNQVPQRVLLGYQVDNAQEHRTKAIIGMHADGELLYFAMAGSRTRDKTKVYALHLIGENEYEGVAFPFQDDSALWELSTYLPFHDFADTDLTMGMLHNIPFGLYFMRLSEALESRREEAIVRMECLNRPH